MRVIELSTANWAVVERGIVVCCGFASNADAWRWIDRNTDQGRSDTDQHNRIREAFAARD